MAKPTWSWAGEPVNLEAAASDADKWLALLARNASVLRMPPADYINLIDCRAALAKFIGAGVPESDSIGMDGGAMNEGGK